MPPPSAFNSRKIWKGFLKKRVRERFFNPNWKKVFSRRVGGPKNSKKWGTRFFKTPFFNENKKKTFPFKFPKVFFNHFFEKKKNRSGLRN